MLDRSFSKPLNSPVERMTSAIPPSAKRPRRFHVGLVYPTSMRQDCSPHPRPNPMYQNNATEVMVVISVLSTHLVPETFLNPFFPKLSSMHSPSQWQSRKLPSLPKTTTSPPRNHRAARQRMASLHRPAELVSKGSVSFRSRISSPQSTMIRAKCSVHGTSL